MKNISNEDSTDTVLTSKEKLIVGVVLTFICFVTIAFNVLVIVAITSSRKLRKVNAYYLISLAVADLCVGCFVMPPYIAYLYSGKWLLGQTAWIVWKTFDFVYCSASVMNICALSIDRYNAVAHPIKSLRTRTRRRCLLTISVMWIVCCVALSAMMSLWKHFMGLDEAAPVYVSNQKTGIFTIVVDVFTFYIPLLIMLITYGRISKVLIKLQSRRSNKTVRRFSLCRLPQRSNSCPASQLFPRSLRAKGFIESLGLKIKTSNSFDLTKTNMYRQSRRRSSLETIGRSSSMPRSNTSSTTCSSAPSMDTKPSRKWSTNVRLQSFKCILPSSMSSESGLDNLLVNMKPSDEISLSEIPKFYKSEPDLSMSHSIDSSTDELSGKQTRTVFVDVHVGDSQPQEQITSTIMSVNALTPFEISSPAMITEDLQNGEKIQKRRKISRQDVVTYEVASNEAVVSHRSNHKASASEIGFDLNEFKSDAAKSKCQDHWSLGYRGDTRKRQNRTDVILREVIRELSNDGSERSSNDAAVANDHLTVDYNFSSLEDRENLATRDFYEESQSYHDDFKKTIETCLPTRRRLSMETSAFGIDKSGFLMSDFPTRERYEKKSSRCILKRGSISPCMSHRQSLVTSSELQCRRGSIGVSPLIKQATSPNISSRRRWSLAVSPSCRRQIRQVSQCPGYYSPGGTPPTSPEVKRRNTIVLGESEVNTTLHPQRGDLRKASIIRDMLLKDTNRDLIEFATRLETAKHVPEPTMRRSYNTISDFNDLKRKEHIPRECNLRKGSSDSNLAAIGSKNSARADFMDYIKRRRQRKKKLESSHDMKATRVLTMIVGCFLICWLPYKIVYILLVFLPSILPYGLIISLHWILYTNSMFNPIIYVFANQEYRKAVIELVCFKRGNSICNSSA
ncbi:uncharacterized protein [Ptychodera flava]|uniref:uncharacterized protein n=1 Tax=Ptychodera flava TaxID=63121 RepID=UPI00396A21F1